MSQYLLIHEQPCQLQPTDVLRVLYMEPGRVFVGIRYNGGWRVSKQTEIRCWPSTIPVETEVLGFGVELDRFGDLRILAGDEGAVTVRIPRAAVEQIQAAIRECVPAFPDPGTLRAREAEAEASRRKAEADRVADDMKPRGVKRQWWLFPWDAYAEIVDRENERSPGAILDLFSEVSHCTDALADLGSSVFATLDKRTGSRPKSLEAVCRVFEHGAEKYSADNWRRATLGEGGLVASRREYFSAVVRHVMADLSGEAFDTDHVLPDGTEIKGSGLFHLAHAACGVLMMIWHEAHADDPTGAPSIFFRSNDT